MVTPSFEIVRPVVGDSPVLVEVPHAGMGLDATSAGWIEAPTCYLAREADLDVDRLFAGAPRLGATLVVAHVSRMVVDLNRGPDDYDGVTVLGGPDRNQPRGVIWRLTSDGRAVHRDRLPQDELERRLELHYRPYHQALRREIDAKRDQFGFAVMLCAHSMPTPRRIGPADGTAERPADLVPGTRGGTSAAPQWIDRVDRTCRDRGYRVTHDQPYRGGFATSHYGRPADDVHVVQLEIGRWLYMDETTFAPKPEGFAQVTRLADQLVADLVAQATARAQRPGGVT